MGLLLRGLAPLDYIATINSSHLEHRYVRFLRAALYWGNTEPAVDAPTFRWAVGDLLRWVDRLPLTDVKACGCQAC